MRIVAGSLKGMILDTSVSSATRPTSDSVRESIFNILSARIDFEAVRVADLYAGTGALGIEAFSRGADSVVFVETDKKACDVIMNNIALSAKRDESAPKKLAVERTPVLTFVQQVSNYGTFDVVLADPPYDDDVETEVISVVAPGGYLVYETSSRKLEQTHKELFAHARMEEIIVARSMGSTGVVVLRAK